MRSSYLLANETNKIPWEDSRIVFISNARIFGRLELVLVSVSGCE
jgi:hypothetical protein